jgi:hypothetical protein
MVAYMVQQTVVKPKIENPAVLKGENQKVKQAPVPIADILNRRLERLDKKEKLLILEIERRIKYLAKLQSTLDSRKVLLTKVKAEREAEIQNLQELVAKVNVLQP